MKIYDLNVENIKKENVISESICDTLKRFVIDNYLLTKKCQELLRQKLKNNTFIKYNDKFYKFKITSKNNVNPSDYCTDCDFEKNCHGKLKICIVEALFEENTKINLKEVDEYEIAFSGDEDENI